MMMLMLLQTRFIRLQRIKVTGPVTELLEKMTITEFDVFSTVHHSIDLFHLLTLMHNSFIH